MKDTVRIFRSYTVWEYEREEKDLDEASKNGLQLIRGGSFSSLFRRDNTVRYIYQIDFNNNIDNMERYKETFADRNWEYINSTFNNWHYFRKPYQEGMDEEDTRIYTDIQSLQEMRRGYSSRLTVVIVIYLTLIMFQTICMLVNFSGRNLLQILPAYATAALFIYALYCLRQQRNGKLPAGASFLRFLPILALLFLISLILQFIS